MNKALYSGDRKLWPHRLYAILLIVTWLLPPSASIPILTSVLAFFVAYAPNFDTRRALHIGLPFFTMIMWAAPFSLNNSPYEVGKDLFYGLKICACLSVGYFIGCRVHSLKPVIKYWSLVTAVQCIAVIISFFLSDRHIGEIGDQSENGLILPLVSVGMIVPLIESLQTKGQGAAIRYIGRLNCLILLALIGIAVAVSNSRITIVGAGVMTLGAAGFYSHRVRAVIAGTIVAAIFLIMSMTQYQIERGTDTTVIGKFSRSLDEVSFTDDSDPEMRTRNWRGYEAYKAQTMFDDSAISSKFLGNGLGATIPLGGTFILGGEYFDEIPVIHNGFYHVLIKYGIIGVIMYVCTLLMFMRAKRYRADPASVELKILRGLVVVTLLSTAVITGMYNKSALDGVVITLGLLMGYIRNPMRNAMMPRG